LLGDGGSSPDQTRNIEERFVKLVAKRASHVQISFIAAELLRQLSIEGAISEHEPTPALETSSAPSYELNQSAETSYGRLLFGFVGQVIS
jgi:hypothetical protein